jgi:phage terminase small subunit
MYVTTLATYREADSIITASGVLIAVGQDLAPNPALGIRNGADATAARWAKTFGLTPDSQPLAPPQAHEGPRRLPHLVEGA